ncbi:flagellar hook assembly protein FlgD [Gottfriedia luciferensis]|uniref:flagellar hook assembly protein FlgD n=1 Tax=Gottfriedia luciferensis TaxID=178774 RepID=UPI000B43272F|nr:flagellar hook assembly protein FlgD [Gottfriedia luciferensis]
MSTSTILDALKSINQSDSKSSKKVGNDLGKDDFLKLLMAQMKNQDPLSPMQDKDYIAQLATFSSLEQMTNMNTSLNNFLDSMSTNLLQFSELIGKKVSYVVLSQDGTSSTVEESVVKSVERNSKGFLVHLANGKDTYTQFISKISDNT